ncbi:hypothetical protein ABBQ32_009762 [Trebouxia sp. C0010 RCD-2024]
MSINDGYEQEFTRLQRLSDTFETTYPSQEQEQGPLNEPDSIPPGNADLSTEASNCSRWVYLGWQQTVYSDSTDIAGLTPDVWIKKLEWFAGQVRTSQTAAQVARKEHGDLYKASTYRCLFRGLQRHLHAAWEKLFRASSQSPYDEPDMFCRQKPQYRQLQDNIDAALKRTEPCETRFRRSILT